MIKVSNRRIIRKLSFKSFLANKTRNMIAIIAIALTTTLFTSLFTIAVTMNYSWQQQTMRMVGGYSHGSFKYLNQETLDLLKEHPLIKEYGTTLLLGMPVEAPFYKYHAELRYGDDNGARMFYSYPTTGHMPSKIRELATGTAVLNLLGIPHEIGQEITITYPLGSDTITDTFTLSGFWETDEAIQSSQIWLSKEYVEGQLASYIPSETEYIGTWGLDLLFNSSKGIVKNMSIVAEDSGYNIEDIDATNYLDIGVNWAYTSTHLNQADRVGTMAAIFAIALLIILAGYLIIYNIFHISISNDIRFYGLLKTLGTTKKQIKHLIHNQAIMLSVFGIPFGLIIGYFIGDRLTEIIMNSMSRTTSYSTTNPWIFIGSAVFSCCTVLLSCRKPGKMAAAVSPIEAVRYVETSNSRKMIKKTKNGSKVYQMAMANIMRNRKKTILVILSLTLSVILLNTSYSFAKGFDMDKYLSKFVVSDFIVGHADYFQNRFYEESEEVSESIITKINSIEGITETGRVYFYTDHACIYPTKKAYLEYYSDMPEEYLVPGIESMDENEEIRMNINIYGLDELPMEYLTIVEGNLDKEKMKNTHSVVQFIDEDDYGNPEMFQAIYEIGDKVNVHYTDYIMDKAGNVVDDKGFYVDYEVIATVLMPRAMSSRRYGSLQLIMSADILKQDAKEKCSTMIYMANADANDISGIETILKDYTKNDEPTMDYESKSSYAKEFKAYQDMFILVAGALSLIIGVVGILNFINSELTGIITRRRELAMLQSIGMTGKQLKIMLILEGLFYGGVATIVALLVSIGLGYLLIKPIENMLWFFTYRLTVTPIICIIPIFFSMGIIVPLLTYRVISKQSVVERLRETE